MHVGQPIRAELLYPVYVDNQLVLPVKTIVTGAVVSLTPDRHRRIQARLRGDFTPFHTPVVRFNAIQPPTGPPITIETTDAREGAPIYRIAPTPPVKGGLLGQYYAIARQTMRDTWSTLTGPGKGDRFVQFIYSQLPYHPERIARATAWTVETSASASLTPIPAPPESLAAAPPAPVSAAQDAPPTWVIQAYLDSAISSKDSATNQKIQATVAEPVLNPDGSVAVPQGAILSGTITQARPARHFDRAGVLRFNFSQLILPNQQPQTVRTTLAGADSGSPRQLAMDSEGEVKPKPQDKIVIPALLLLAAARPLDQDHDGGNGIGHQFGKDAVASNGIGLIGFIVGTAARQPNFAAGLGYYSAAVAIYPRYIGRGAEVSFPKNTRIVVQTTATRSSALKSEK